MKKTLALVCLLALMLSLSALAFAEKSAPNTGTGFPDRGEAPFGGAQMGGGFPFRAGASVDFAELVTKGVISQETCDKINAYMEEHMPAEPPEMDGQPPEMDGQPPEMDGQPPEMNGQPPQMGGRGPRMNGQPPQMNGQPPQMDGQPPEMSGEFPMPDGQMPWTDGEAPEWSGLDPAVEGLLNDMLNDGVITQAEYEALCSALKESE